MTSILKKKENGTNLLLTLSEVTLSLILLNEVNPCLLKRGIKKRINDNSWQQADPDRRGVLKHFM